MPQMISVLECYTLPVLMLHFSSLGLVSPEDVVSLFMKHWEFLHISFKQTSLVECNCLHV